VDARPDACGEFQILGRIGLTTDLQRNRPGGIVPVLHSGVGCPGFIGSEENVEQAEWWTTPLKLVVGPPPSRPGTLRLTVALTDAKTSNGTVKTCRRTLRT
jgi:hypothetical protein